MRGLGALYILEENSQYKVLRPTLLGRLNDRGRPQDDKFMRAVSAQTTSPHRHPVADL